jgi:hypothetical protein
VYFSSAIAIVQEPAGGANPGRAPPGPSCAPLAGERDPVAVAAPPRDIKPSRIHRADVGGLGIEHPGQHDPSAGLQSRREHRRQRHQGTGENVGDDDVERRSGSRGALAGEDEGRGNAVGKRIRAARGDRLRVDVDADDCAGAELRSGDRQDSRAAAVIEHALAAAKLRGEPGEAQPRRRVRAGTECEPGVEGDVDGIGVRRHAP